MKYIALAICTVFFLRGLAAFIWPDWHLRSSEDYDETAPPSRSQAYLEGVALAVLGGCGLWAILLGPGGPVDAVP